MKNINNTIKGVKDLKYKLKVAYEEAKKDPYFKELTDSINLSDDELMKHTSLFEDSKEEYKNCKSCKNLAACKNKMTGFCFLPVLKEGKLNFSYVACKYKEKYLNDCKYQKNVTSMDVPREIREAKIKDIYTDDKQREKVIKWILNYIKEYKKGKFGKGLYLHGNFGCGKTYLLAAMFNELAKENVRSVITYWPEYLRSLKSSYSSSSSYEFKDKYNEVVKRHIAIEIILNMLIGKSSNLYNELYKEGYLLSQPDLEYEFGNEYSHVLIGGQSKNPQKVYEKIAEKIQEMKNNDINVQEFNRIKKKIYGDYAVEYNNVADIGRMFTSDYIKGINSFEYMDKFEEIDAEYAKQVLKEIFTEDKMIMSVIKGKN